eukprot:Gb_38318 [translate_table: standard]
MNISYSLVGCKHAIYCFRFSIINASLIQNPSRSGSVCLDVINQTWSPMFGEKHTVAGHSTLLDNFFQGLKLSCYLSDLVNVFEVFLPQLLLYPNPTDPLNGDAAALMMRDRDAYEQKVKEYCARYAKAEDIGARQEEESSDDEISEDEYMSSDEEIAGHADP